MERVEKKRVQNEKKFSSWIDLPYAGRRYWFEIKGKFGWKAKYVKEVNADEETIRFYQEIYNEEGILVEIHEKFPVDKGHKKVKG